MLKSKFSHITNDEVLVEVGDFVLMGDAVFAEDLINKTDTVYVENVLGGIHEGIRKNLWWANSISEEKLSKVEMKTFIREQQLV